MDAVDVLFLGMSIGWQTGDEAAFSAVRELWLDRLRASDYWGSFRSFIHQLSDTSDRTELGVNDPALYFELTHDLAARPACLEILPTRLHPWPALRDSRAFTGVDLDIQLPAPTSRSAAARDRLLLSRGLTVKEPVTAADGLQRGLDLLREHSVDDRVLSLVALFVGMTKRSMTLEKMHAEVFSWVLGLPHSAPLAAVADTAARCIVRGMSSGEAIARILALAEAHVPVDANSCLWRSEVGLAAIRESFDEVPGRPVITNEGRVFHLTSGLKRTLLKMRPDLDEQRIGPLPDGESYIFDEYVRSGQAWREMIENMTAAGLSPAGAYAAEITGILPPSSRGFRQYRDVRDWKNAIEKYLSENPAETYDREADEQVSDMCYLSLLCGLGDKSLDSIRATIEDLEKPDSVPGELVSQLGPGLVLSIGDEVHEYVDAAREIALAASGMRVASGVDEVVDKLMNEQDFSVGLIPSLYCLATAVIGGKRGE